MYPFIFSLDVDTEPISNATNVWPWFIKKLRIVFTNFNNQNRTKYETSIIALIAIENF